MRYTQWVDPNLDEVEDQEEMKRVLKVCNELIGTDKGRAAFCIAIGKDLRRLCCQPTAILEQLRESIIHSPAENDEWGQRDARRIGVEFIEMMLEVREVIKRRIGGLPIFDDEEDEKRWRAKNG